MTSSQHQYLQEVCPAAIIANVMILLTPGTTSFKLLFRNETSNDMRSFNVKPYYRSKKTIDLCR